MRSDSEFRSPGIERCIGNELPQDGEDTHLDASRRANRNDTVISKHFNTIGITGVGQASAGHPVGRFPPLQLSPSIARGSHAENSNQDDPKPSHNLKQLLLCKDTPKFNKKEIKQEEKRQQGV